MLKAQVLRRSLSLFNRAPHSRIAHIAARNGHETVKIQRFRIRKPFLSKSRLVGTIAVASAFYGFARYIGLEIVLEGEDEKDANEDSVSKLNDQSPVKEADSKPELPVDPSGQEDSEKTSGDDEQEEGDKDEEEDNAILFIPTGFSRPRRRVFYKGSDPEWQEFRSIASNKARVHKIRRELVSAVRSSVAKQPSVTTRLGKLDLTKGQVWIEFRFPDAPPIEYDRPGIELTDDLEWRKTVRPVEANHHHLLSKALFPHGTASVLYQDTKRRVQRSWNQVKIYIGWQEKDPLDQWSDWVKHINTKIHEARADNEAKAPPSSVSSHPSPSSSSDIRPTDPSSPTTRADNLVKDFSLPDIKSLTMDLSQFRQNFRKAFQPTPLSVPRGSFVVMGLVEVWGSRARMTLSVTAVYDPKVSRYIAMRAQTWNLVDHQQVAKGGQ